METHRTIQEAFELKRQKLLHDHIDRLSRDAFTQKLDYEAALLVVQDLWTEVQTLQFALKEERHRLAESNKLLEEITQSKERLKSFVFRMHKSLSDGNTITEREFAAGMGTALVAEGSC